MRRIGKNRKCEKCGKVVKPGGIGSHMRLAHGIKVKIVVNHLSEDSSHSSEDSSHLSGNSSHLSHSSHLSERVQRPSDYVKKKSEVVIETKDSPAIQSPDEWGRMLCKKCGGWFMPYEWFETKDFLQYKPYCKDGKRHELI